MSNEEYSEASAVYLELLRLHQKRGDSSRCEVIRYLVALADIALELELHDEALRWAVEATKRAEAASDEASLGAALYIQARASAMMGDFAQALNLAERALILQRRLNEPPKRIGRTLQLLAWAHLSLEDWSDAIRVGRKAMAIFFKARSPALVETCLNLLIALRENGELDEAIALGEVLLETTRAVESRSYMQADVLNHLGRTWHAWGDAKKASALFKEAIALTKSGRDMAVLLHNLAAASNSTGDRDAAIELGELALQLHREVRPGSPLLGAADHLLMDFALHSTPRRMTARPVHASTIWHCSTPRPVTSRRPSLWARRPFGAAARTTRSAATSPSRSSTWPWRIGTEAGRSWPFPTTARPLRLRR
jgi:tetratricopeptide (TPR) repeat protein